MPKFAAILRTGPLSAWFGLIVLSIYLTAAILAPLVAPFGETQIVGDQYLPWDSTHLLGTDNLGRDMLSRLIYGARNTIGIALAATVLSFAVGTMGGLFAAMVGGWPDQILSRLVDLLMSIPLLIFALMLLAIFGSSIVNLVLIIAILDSTRVFRLARSVGLGIAVNDYIEAARIRGEGLGWLIVREVMPNAMAPLAAEFGLRFCFVFLTIASLSFLGLGVPPPTAEWGSMVRDNASLISFGDITPLLPAAAIALLTVGVNFIVDWFLHRASGLKG